MALYIGVPEECVPYAGQLHIAANRQITIDPQIWVRKDLEKAKEDATRESLKMDGTPAVYEVEFTVPENWSTSVYNKEEGSYRNVSSVVLRRRIV